MFVRDMRCCSVVTVIVDVFVVCLCVVIWSSGFYHLKAEATVPAPASAAATEEVAETVTEAADRSGPALASEPRKTRGKGPKKAAEGEPKEKDIAAKKVAPKKRGRKAAAVAAPNKEEEETEKKPVAKRGRKAMASVEEEVRTIDEESNEEKRAEDAPELAVPEPEVSSSTKNQAAARKAMIDMINLGKKSTRKPGKKK